MLSPTISLLRAATDGTYALGAFNVYNLEGTRAVLAAAETNRSPAILQILPTALKQGGAPLISLCLKAAQEASVPISVHLDHCRSKAEIEKALQAGLTSIMADGSPLPYGENAAFTREMVTLVHKRRGMVEAELGRLTGKEDDIAVAEFEARLTDPEQARGFISETGADALAVCIGNVHGRYSGEPRLDFDRLAAIRAAVSVPLVLHGASGLGETLVRRSIELGICKFNVNTEVREAYLGALREGLGSPRIDLLDLMARAIDAMKDVVSAKMRLFGSVDRA